MEHRSDDLLESLLVCPVCKGRLDVEPASVQCQRCGATFPPHESDYYALLPGHLLERDESEWQKRQHEMETWYQDLARSPEWASSCFTNDYEPFAHLLSTISGTVLDLGGGNGVARHFLPTDVRYIVVDPSLDWLGAEWASIAVRFPCLSERPSFVRGVGEYLPFRAAAFDAVLAMWSLNHVSDPKHVFREVHRVLKPGGVFLAVLEDMEPAWSDLFDPSFRSSAMPRLGLLILEDMKPGLRDVLRRAFLGDNERRRVAVAIEKLRCCLPGQDWRTQGDHLRLPESDLRAWSKPYFDVTNRTWIGQYLTYMFARN